MTSRGNATHSFGGRNTNATQTLGGHSLVVELSFLERSSSSVVNSFFVPRAFLERWKTFGSRWPVVSEIWKNYRILNVSQTLSKRNAVAMKRQDIRSPRSLEKRSAVVTQTKNIGKCTGSVRTTFPIICNDHVAFEERSPNDLVTTEERFTTIAEHFSYDRGTFYNYRATRAERIYKTLDGHQIFWAWILLLTKM